MAYSRESLPVSHDNEHGIHIESMVNAIINDCNTNAIFGSVDERREYAIRVVELKSAIVNNDQIAPLNAAAYISNLDQGVAKKVGSLANDLIENGQVSEEALDALTALPVPAPAFGKVIEDFYKKAISAHEAALKVKSQNEYNAHWQTAEDISVVATRIARDIPEIKNGRTIVAQSGSAIHGHYLKSVIRDAKTNTSKTSAVNSFIEMSHASHIVDSNPFIKNFGITAAGVAITGLLMSTVPVGAAHAEAKIEKVETNESQKTIKSTNETVILPAAAPAPDKEQKQQEVKSDKAVEIPPTAAVAPKTETLAPTDKNETTPNTKTETSKSSGIIMDLPKSEDKPTEPVSDEKNKSNPTPVNAPKETAADNVQSNEVSNSTGNKSTNEQTDSKNTSESNENKTPGETQTPTVGEESDSIKIDIPDSKNEQKPTKETPVPGEDKQDKSDDKDKILDYLKEDGPIAISLDDVKKMTKERKDDNDEPKDDSDDKKDDVKVETIGQQNTQPTQKEKFNKEITKLIGGNGPIAMSLEDVKKNTKERKDDDKSNFKPQFEFAPSAELPPPPKPKTDTYQSAPIPEHIIDPSFAGETQWSPETLAYIRDNLEMYTNIEKQTGLEWEIVAALHVREASMSMSNPANGQGIFGLIDSGITFAPGPITKEEFTRQGVMAANFFKEKAKNNSRVGGPLALSNPDKVKDTLFAYNGIANGYIAQAKELGFTLGAEGSPYVMNLADDNRNSKKNPNWDQIITDYGEMRDANQSPGAWVLIDGLMRIEQKARDQAVAKQQAEAQAFEAKKAAEAKAAADAAEAERKARTISNKEVEPFNGWHRPVPANSAVSPQYAGHKGIDFAVKSGTPFYAAAGGVAKVVIYDDVRDDAFCIAAFDKLGRNTNEIKDPVQKEVRITRMINGDEYLLIYSHMSQIDIKDGDIVSAGQQIGKTGNSGCSTGDHAHFEVRKNGVAIDPNLVLNGAINVSSSEIKVNDDGHGHSKQEHDSAEAVPAGVGAAEPGDEQKTRLEAIKKVAELKRRMAEKNKSSEGYLAIR